jgi:oligopeptide transport system substrate-binding protein
MCLIRGPEHPERDSTELVEVSGYSRGVEGYSWDVGDHGLFESPGSRLRRRGVPIEDLLGTRRALTSQLYPSTTARTPSLRIVSLPIMHNVKWIFFGYLALVALIAAGIGVSFSFTPSRDPYTAYTSYSANIKTLDPAEIDDTESDAVAGCVFECLYNYEYGKEPYTLIPELARSLPETSADGHTITIHLKPGIHFYDPEKQLWKDGIGPEIKAADIVYSWKRVCNFQLGVTANYSAIFQGKIVGIDDWYNYTQSCKGPDDIDWDKPVAGLTAVDNYTLQIQLVDPDPQLRYQIAQSPTAAVCRQVVEFYKDKFKLHPVGSGPYIITQNLPEQRIIMETNPTYRGGLQAMPGQPVADADRLPVIKRVQWTYYDEDLPRWFIFRQGLLDANGIPKDTFNQAIRPGGDLTDQMKRDGIQLIKVPAPEVFYTGFNMLDPVVGKNKPLRQAISMGFDRKTFIDIYLNGRGQPAIGPIPPGFPTFDSSLVNPYTRFDVAGAKAKLQEAQQINGGPIPPLNLLIGSTDTAARQDAEFFASQMAQIGLTIKTQYTTWARFQEMVDSKQAQIFDLGWVADYPDEQTFWQLFYSKNAGVGGVNAVNYSNPQFDALYEKSSVMNPGPERDALYRQMQAIVMEDCPWSFNFYPVGYELLHGWVKDFKVMDYGHGMRAHTRIDFAEREQWLKSH